jgi:hypothetical protein
MHDIKDADLADAILRSLSCALVSRINETEFDDVLPEVWWLIQEGLLCGTSHGTDAILTYLHDDVMSRFREPDPIKPLNSPLGMIFVLMTASSLHEEFQPGAGDTGLRSLLLSAATEARYQDATLSAP